MTRGQGPATARLPNRLMAEYYAQRSSGGLAHHRGQTTISDEGQTGGASRRASTPTGMTEGLEGNDQPAVA